MAHILVLNGPNLNLLGLREPGHYGQDTLATIEGRLGALAAGHQIAFFQSNAERRLIERIHQAGTEGVDFILFNPAALTPPASRCAMHCQSPSRSSRSMSRTCTPANRFRHHSLSVGRGGRRDQRSRRTRVRTGSGRRCAG